MRDEGLVVGDEPFKRLMMLGMVLQGGKKMSDQLAMPMIRKATGSIRR